MAKTEEIDAHILPGFAERIQPVVREAPSADQENFSALMAQRRQIFEMKTAEQNHFGTAPSEVGRSDIEEHLSFLEAHLAETERQIENAGHNSPVWHEKEELLCSIPGVGSATAHVLMEEVSEFGQTNRQEIAKLAGFASLNRDSGKHRRQHSNWGGQGSVRRTLYMAALSAHNRRIRSFYDRPVERGKAKKRASVACMRKLLAIMNTMMKNETPWKPECQTSST